MPNLKIEENHAQFCANAGMGAIGKVVAVNIFNGNNDGFDTVTAKWVNSKTTSCSRRSRGTIGKSEGAAAPDLQKPALGLSAHVTAMYRFAIRSGQ